MEKLHFEDKVLIFEHYNGNLNSVDSNQIYFSNHIVEAKNQINENIKPRNIIKVTLKDDGDIRLNELYFLGVLFESSSGYLSLKYLINENFLIIGFETLLVAFEINTLNIKWCLNDFTNMIAIEMFDEDIFIYDELELVRVNFSGNIKWRFSGFDHFISYIGTENFTFHNNYIKMIDSNEYVYKVNYDGELVK